MSDSIKYNCPDCDLDLENCDGCPRIIDKNKNKKKYKDYNEYWEDLKRQLNDITSIHTTPKVLNNYGFDSVACRNCYVNPKNGGNGFCNCTLGQQTFTNIC